MTNTTFLVKKASFGAFRAVGASLLIVLLSSSTVADTLADADVLSVEVKQQSAEKWHFEVTVSHPDTSWEDYVDGWDVVLANGKVIKLNAVEQFTRTLWHPHVGQKSFTRSQSGITIPASIKSVLVRAHDKIHGFGGKTLQVHLPRKIIGFNLLFGEPFIHEQAVNIALTGVPKGFR